MTLFGMIGMNTEVVYVKSNIVFKRHFEFESPSIVAIWISVQTLQGKIMICCCYHPPNKTDFWDEFDTVIDQVKQSDNYGYMFVLDDLNADPKTNNGNKLIQLCLEHNLQYLINEPTRITATSQKFWIRFLQMHQILYLVCQSPRL